MKKHIRAITSLLTICLMLATLILPVSAADLGTYTGTLHPGGMSADDKDQLNYMEESLWHGQTPNADSAPGNFELSYTVTFFDATRKIYYKLWAFNESTNYTLTRSQRNADWYSVQLGYYVYTCIYQTNGRCSTASGTGSLGTRFEFDTPAQPTEGLFPFGIVTYPDDGALFDIKWYKAPDLSELGESSDLSEIDFNISGLEVKITPSLKVGMTEEDRSHMDDGTEWDKDYFDVMVINNSDTWYQIRFGVKNFFGNSHEYSWICNSQEWNYAPKVLESMKYESDGQLVDGTFETVEKQFGNSEWHIVGGHSAYEQMIQWDDLDLKANALYYFYVEATPAVSKYASNLVNDSPLSKKENSQYAFSHNKNGNVVVYDPDAQQALIGAKPTIIYIATFSLADAIPYNPNNENIYSGSMSNYTPDPSAGKVYAWEDKNGTVFGSGGGLNYDYNFDVGSVSLTDMKGLIDSTSGFVGLFQGLMGIFPAFVWVIIAAGLTALVILRILGR